MKHHPSASGSEALAEVLVTAVRHAYARGNEPESLTALDTPPVDLLIPAPMADDRLQQRGHNQAWELARRVGRTLNLPARADLVMRWPGTMPQQALDRASRRTNLRGAFALSTPTSGNQLHGQRVALIDDVMTTGATLEALARIVLAAGATEVHAWTVARTPN